MKQILIILISIVLSNTSFPQTDSLFFRLDEFVKNKKAQIGISVKSLKTPYNLEIGNNYTYPMQSVYKLHLAMYILKMEDEGKIYIQDSVLISKESLKPNTWSPIRDLYPEGNKFLKIEEIIRFTVSQSDNNGCDILFNIAGGTKPVEEYIQSLGIKSISIKATEEEMHTNSELQFTNYTNPASASELLYLLIKKKILSDKNTSFLLNCLTETSTGPNRLKGLLPANTVVSHKTGTGDVDQSGFFSAVNDIGIITLPNGEKYILSVFVCKSKYDLEENEKMISQISRIVFDFFNQNLNN